MGDLECPAQRDHEQVAATPASRILMRGPILRYAFATTQFLRFVRDGTIE